MWWRTVTRTRTRTASTIMTGRWGGQGLGWGCRWKWHAWSSLGRTNKMLTVYSWKQILVHLSHQIWGYLHSCLSDKLPTIGIERTEREEQYILAREIFFFFLVFSQKDKVSIFWCIKSWSQKMQIDHHYKKFCKIWLHFSNSQKNGFLKFIFLRKLLQKMLLIRPLLFNLSSFLVENKSVAPVHYYRYFPDPEEES